jgi:NAD-dependent dihydropyrimidine dehydrogenase PreA subunit
MSLFIKVEIDMGRCVGIERCGQCVQVCPVTIFGEKENDPVIIEENEDECTLCDLCVEECTPGAISICKVYEE